MSDGKRRTEEERTGTRTGTGTGEEGTDGSDGRKEDGPTGEKWTVREGSKTRQSRPEKSTLGYGKRRGDGNSPAATALPGPPPASPWGLPRSFPVLTSPSFPLVTCISGDCRQTIEARRKC